MPVNKQRRLLNVKYITDVVPTEDGSILYLSSGESHTVAESFEFFETELEIQ